MRPILVVNPVDDEAFGVMAEALLDGGTSSTGELQRQLRQRYDRAVVHARELSSEPFVIWYVYRDGLWVNARRTRDQRGAPPNMPDPRDDECRGQGRARPRADEENRSGRWPTEGPLDPGR